jgi:choline dehydrogenase-like flavoprotein
VTAGAGDGTSHDVVIVGAGISGALIAKRLTKAGLRVLVLEAGPATAWTFDGYARHLEHFYEAAGKGPESAWPPAMGAPQPDTADVRAGNGYFIQQGPDRYGSSYTRLLGGSTLHWLGVCLRMLPEDFELRSRYGVGRDWPLGYPDLEPYYREAEWEIGVSADAADQSHLGIEFPDGYDYPMRALPPSYSDQVLGSAVDGMTVTLGRQPFALRVRSYPAARNSMPRDGYEPAGAVDERGAGQALARDLGQRCAGNTACTPICPIQAKYNAQKSLAQADRANLGVIAQAVASRVLVDPASGLVTGVEYQHYDSPDSPRHTRRTARARGYVLAAHAVENAKLLLASGLGGAGSHVGMSLMDHPALYAWGLSPVNVGAFRGPLSTAGIDDLRGGAFRASHAAFRFDGGARHERRGGGGRPRDVRHPVAPSPGGDPATAGPVLRRRRATAGAGQQGHHRPQVRRPARQPAPGDQLPRRRLHPRGDGRRHRRLPAGVQPGGHRGPYRSRSGHLVPFGRL